MTTYRQPINVLGQLEECISLHDPSERKCQARVDEGLCDKAVTTCAMQAAQLIRRELWVDRVPSRAKDGKAGLRGMMAHVTRREGS